MPANAWTALLDADLDAEPFTRRALALAEAELRELALVALADWAGTEVASRELFRAIASLQRPSWGSWNGLLGALRKARRHALRDGDPATRRRVEAAAVLARVVARLDDRVPPERAERLEPLAELVRRPIKRLRTGDLLSLPIPLRNRIVHDVPATAAWWESARDALLPLVELHAEASPVRDLLDRAGLPAPWLIEHEGSRFAFHGLEDGGSAVYVGPRGERHHDADRGAQILAVWKRLLGRADAQAKDFGALLHKLAPEEIKGVLLGDYLVGPPVGSGGFATVHAARQLSTGRKVALKILRDGLAADVRARFQQEAAFLARLEHPGIVGVLASGEESWQLPRHVDPGEQAWLAEFTRGAAVRHFIALEWIAGRTLEEVFREGAPDRTTITRWFVEAASALGDVHAAGLIHRDVKPGNLMVDDDGAIRLMDFGIARSRDDERTLVTQTGHAVGTPAYMSPEQIRGAVEPGAGGRDGEAAGAEVDAELGPATDVYSLCATFYELYTHARLFGHDTEASRSVETRKLRGELPERPRRIDASLPWELETILLGGLQAEPADRYAKMAELEADLRRFLADEPIRYRRPGIARRLRLAYRRNRLVWHLLGAFLVAAIAGVVVYVRDVEAQRARAEANAGEAKAMGALAIRRQRAAVELAKEAAEQARLAEERREEAEGATAVARREEERARRRATIAEDAVKVLVYEVTRGFEGLPGPRVRAARRALLRKALGSLKELRDLDDEEATESLTAAEAHFQVGAVALDAGLVDEARPALEEAVARSRRLVEATPDDPRAARMLARALGELGHALRLGGDLAGARATFEEAQRRMGDLEATDGQRSLLTGSVAASSLRGLAMVLEEQGELADAAAIYARLSDLARQFIRSDPDEPKHRGLLGSTLGSLGAARLKQGHIEEARVSLHEAEGIARELYEADPIAWPSRAGLARILVSLGACDLARNDFAGMRAWTGEAATLLRGMVEEDPDNSAARRRLADAFLTLGVADVRQEKPRDALGRLREALSLLQALDAERKSGDHIPSADDRGDVLYESRIAYALAWVGTALDAVGDHDGSSKALDDSEAQFRALCEADPSDAVVKKGLVETLLRRGFLEESRGRIDASLAALDEAAEIGIPLLEASPSNMQLRSHMLEACFVRAKLLRQHKQTVRITYLENVLKLFDARFLWDDRIVVSHQWSLKWYQAAMLQLRRHDEAVAACRRALEIYEKAPGRNPRAADLVEFAAELLHDAEVVAGERPPASRNDWSLIGNDRFAAKRWAEALAAFEAAFALDPARQRGQDLLEAARCAAMLAAEENEDAETRKLEALDLLGRAVAGHKEAMLEKRATLEATADASRRAELARELAEAQAELDYIQKDRYFAAIRGPALDAVLSIAPPEASVPDAATAVIAKADRERIEGRFEAALAIIEAHLVREPADADAHDVRQEILVSLGRAEAARAEYEALAVARDDASWDLLAGRLLHDAAAEEVIYRAALRREPDHQRLHRALGRVLAAQGRLEEAEHVLRRATELPAPTRHDAEAAHGALVEVGARAGRADELVAHYERRLAEGADDPILRSWLGAALTLAGERERARAELDAALAAAPDDATVRTTLAIHLVKVGERDGAAAAFRRALELDPLSVRAIHGAAILHLSQGKADPALPLLVAARRLAPLDPDVASDLGVLHAMRGQLDECDRLLVEALRLDPRHDVTMGRIGSLALQRADVETAVTWLERASATAPDDGDHWFTLARAYEKAGRHDEARAALENGEARRSESDFQVWLSTEETTVLDRAAMTVRRLIHTAHELLFAGKTEAAERRLRSALELDPDALAAHVALERILLRRGEPEAALAHASRAAELVSDRSPAIRARAAIRVADRMWDLRRFPEAASRYRSVLAEFGEAVPASEGLAAIVEALEESDGDATITTVDGVRIGECAKENHCAPEALAAVLRHHGANVDLDALAGSLIDGESGASFVRILEVLDAREDVEAVPFIATPDVIRSLIEQRLPVVITQRLLADGRYTGHASVIVGVDEARRVFLLEDSNWVAGYERVGWESVRGHRAILVAPPEVAKRLRKTLPRPRDARRFGWAEQRLASGEQLAEAIEALEVDLVENEAWKTEPWPHFLLGSLYAATGALPTAASYFERAADLDPSSGEYPTALGRARLALGDIDEAAAAFEHGLAIAPGQIAPHSGLAEIILDHRLPAAKDEAARSALIDAALEHLAALAEVEPGNGAVHFHVGRLLADRGDAEAALRALLRSAATGGPPEAYRGIGLLHAQAGRRERAERALRRYVAGTTDAAGRAEMEALLKRWADEGAGE